MNDTTDDELKPLPEGYVMEPDGYCPLCCTLSCGRHKDRE